LLKNELEVCMNKIVKYASFFLILVLILGSGSPAVAEESQVTITGAVISISEGTGFEVDTEEGEVETILIPEEMEFPDIELGDQVLVEGERLEDGTILAESVDVEEGEEEVEKTESAYCDPEKEMGSHPVAAALAEMYEVPEDEIMAYFCDGFGFGQIMLALQTDVEHYGEYLAQREAGQGWGQIWQELGLIGKPGAATSPPGHLKRPDHAGGPPDHAGGPPDHAGGPPDHAGGPPDHAGGPPDHAGGPPDHAGGPKDKSY
jgi:hypothetical protein